MIKNAYVHKWLDGAKKEAKQNLSFLIYGRSKYKYDSRCDLFKIQ